MQAAAPAQGRTVPKRKAIQTKNIYGTCNSSRQRTTPRERLQSGRREESLDGAPPPRKKSPKTRRDEIKSKAKQAPTIASTTHPRPAAYLSGPTFYTIDPLNDPKQRNRDAARAQPPDK